ncbi:SdrD B-like domain-containing protein [Microcoleus sp. Pol12B4]|uniref:SdrD B-like domain-containing protein n=1 Tax=Microcoleus sp. Pol12B4 TaxID=3055395 RepID=UPI002FD03391
MKNLTLLPSNNLISALDSNNNSTLETGGLATLTNNLKFAQQINSPGPEPLPTFTSRIQGTKFTNDLNRNGIFDAAEDLPQPGVTIFLDLNNNGQLDSGESQTQTDNLGGYSFSNLPPATYTVQEIVPPGFTRVTRVQGVTVVANETTNFDIVNRLDVAQIPPIVTGRISGRKFNDLNRNGRPDALSDQTQPGVTIFLDQNNNGQLDSGELQTQTDSLGGYSFSNLPPATYTVQEIVPAGFTRITPVQAVAVVANQTTNFDILNGFSFVPIPPTVTGSISGRKFNDINANGILDVGEPGIPGFTIYIDINRNNTFDINEPSTLTDATGSYQFNGLQPGTFTLREVQQPGFVATQVPNPVTIPREPDFIASQLPNPVTIPPVRGFNVENINFGNARTTPPIGIPGILEFSNPSYSVNEDGTTSLEVMVTRTGGSLGTVDVTVLASDGTANAGTDYNPTPITVSFIDGDTTPKTIRIPIINDALFEPNETINVSLVNPTNGATLGVQTAATLIINRSDSGVPLNIDNVGNLQSIARDPLIRESGFDLSANALAIVSAQQGGSGNFIDPLINPGQVARGITYDEGQSIIINVGNGFDQKFSFRYASPFAEHQVTIYEGVNGTGNVLASVQLPRTTDSNLTPGAYILESNSSSNLLFQGIGKSVTLGNQPNKLVIGDITFG